ncbi:hypothetical protein I8752_12845 [Nostocaceae cyanobacterium CENA369]|uniref:Outer membrane protein beta-barrel domain-containing protein n=1 Tax=Dendronalium phyllosphericum CENA369 TaxID=1725256 RepID=A0A8J7LDH5_9NOST|nr:hypothetical protein [Dendronalium phyllosphericum]MBH8573892.1 hypothetical protein [Dendronalium phyllosphericum CENA369]
MNTIFLRKGVLLPIVAVVVLGSGFSAKAQTTDNVSSQQLIEPAVTAVSSNQSNTELETKSQELSTETPANQTQTSDSTALQQFPSVSAQESASRTLTPVPGTVATSSGALTPETSEYAEPTSATSAPPAPVVAQSNIDIGRPTRGGRSYIGVAGNIGLDGNSASLGDGNFAAISKIGLTNTFSFRPSAVFGDNTTILLPLTYDFSFKQADPFNEPLAIAPYIGAGAAISTGDNSQVGFLVTGGIDVPLNQQFTATAAVNAGFLDDTNIGLMIGVGYNFSGFGF